MYELLQRGSLAYTDLVVPTSAVDRVAHIARKVCQPTALAEVLSDGSWALSPLDSVTRHWVTDRHIGASRGSAH